MKSFRTVRATSVHLRIALAAIFAIVAADRAVAETPRPMPTPVRFYALDCGTLEFENMGRFSDTGEHEGEPGSMIVPCYLIRHGRDWMLWDTGVGDRVATTSGGVSKPGVRLTARRTLVSQLAELGLKPADVGRVALSHLHWDHSGNIDLFPDATFLVAASELAWARTQPSPGGIEKSLIAPLDHARIETSDDDRDVFGDGTVRILKAPGHTPGHRILVVKLREAGPLLITGDLYHTTENYNKELVPRGNVDRAATLASFHRFLRLRNNLDARVVIQHSNTDFEDMPKFPAFLD